MKTFSKLKFKPHTAYIAVVVSIVLALGFYFWRDIVNVWKSDTESTTDRKYAYYISSTLTPHFVYAEFDPLETVYGEKQNVLIKLMNEAPVDSVKVVIYTQDTEGQEHMLEKVEEIKGDNLYTSSWKGAWKVKGKIVGADLIGVSGEDESKVELTFRRSEEHTSELQS